MIDEKLILLAENTDKVYKAGQAAGGGSGEEGQTDLWDLLQENGTRTDYYYGFTGRLWNDTSFCPKYSIYPSIVNYLFAYSQITDLVAALNKTGVELSFKNITGNSNAIRPFEYSNITHIGEVDLSNVSGSMNTFFGRVNADSPLVTIDLLKIPNSGAMVFGTNFFQNQDHLVNIQIEGLIANNFPIGASPLSVESVQSIIDHLKDLTGSTAKTLTVSANTYNNTITDQQKAQIAAKNWNLAY